MNKEKFEISFKEFVEEIKKFAEIAKQEDKCIYTLFIGK